MIKRILNVLENERKRYPLHDVELWVSERVADLSMSMIKATNRYKDNFLAARLVDLARDYSTRPDEIQY